MRRRTSLDAQKTINNPFFGFGHALRSVTIRIRKSCVKQLYLKYSPRDSRLARESISARNPKYNLRCWASIR